LQHLPDPDTSWVGIAGTGNSLEGSHHLLC